jgi:excisionase family DNA binding protein
VRTLADYGRLPAGLIVEAPALIAFKLIRERAAVPSLGGAVDITLTDEDWEEIVEAESRPMPEVISLQAAADETIAEQIRNRRTALTAEELAELLALSRKHIYKLAKSGRIPYLRMGGAVRFDPHMTANWLEGKTVTGPAKRKAA